MKFTKGFTPWNKGKKNLQIGWNKGKKMSPEFCLKISLSSKGKRPWNKGIIKTRKCCICNDELTRNSNRTFNKTCSEICKLKLLSLSHMNKKGALSSNWKGGITPKDRLERGKFKRLIQKKVFERDDYTCQLCGIRGVDLQVDHIQSWSEYIELRFNIDNCRTLCARCHYQITFGKPMLPKVKAWGHNLLGGIEL